MEKSEIFKFISKRKTAFIGSVNENGHPIIRAMLAPRKIENDEIYFTTNTSSKKVGQFTLNKNACVYFYKRGIFRYQGVCLVGEMEVCVDQPTKDAVWRPGDKMFYKQGVTDPDYCVLKFKCQSAEYYCDLKTETIAF
ncbi:MAG: pyridoxamine 5'-phosphate oxidase family protein [Clostridia bacterium]|nr:pyridoxamine 5'-phosphate oxidase family protein [Clostridia bacterium]